ncbi:putative acyltransferase [Gordonia aichiensis NBRC 108223]|uniref:Putative acyltransferase n=1 Tax=Gordonia aichiensis NBRC 108223 TaxID=1220583 RepID=L7KHN4_9ACTN|nr:putative acyltransferase [Gordonia aichiensis NBRC 108223]
MTFGGVILDHVMIGVTAATSVAAGSVEVFLRYTRYGFFALTGFVLTYQYRNRSLEPIGFWRRRFKLIGLPFVTWTLFYWVYGRYRIGGLDTLKAVVADQHSIVTAVKSIGYDLITGNAMYHLYFLSVSMQIYLFFPLILAILKRTWGFHRYQLIASFAIQVGLMYLMVRPPLDFFAHGAAGVVWTHLVITIFPYQFFILAGCVAAMHYEAFQAFVIRWRWPLLAACIATIAATLVYFLHITSTGTTVVRATNVFLPHNVYAFIAIIMMLYCFGTIWQQRRTPGSIPDKVLRTASDRSFGIYLAHPLALSALLPTIAPASWPGFPRVVFAYAMTVAGTVFVVEVLRRSPISLITTGRNRIDWRSQNAGRSVVVAVVAMIGGTITSEVFDVWGGYLFTATGALLAISALLVAWHQWRNRDHEFTEQPV